MTRKAIDTKTTDREIVITRSFNAPRLLVFDMWTHPDHIKYWWGPNGFSTTTLEMNVNAGGVWRFIMHGPDGVDYPNRIEYNEVVRPERLIFDHGTDDDPKQFLATVLFAERGRRTEITMKMLFRSKAEKEMVIEKYGAMEGNRQTMNRLEEYLHRFDENS